MRHQHFHGRFSIIDMTYDDMKLNDRQILDVLARRGQGRGLKIYAETCPQYLFLSGDDLDQPDHHGMKCICSTAFLDVLAPAKAQNCSCWQRSGIYVGPRWLQPPALIVIIKISVQLSTLLTPS